MTDTDPKPAVPFAVDITFQLGDVVFATDKRGRLGYWNIESEQLFGYSAGEVLGRPFDVVCLAAPGGCAVDLHAILAGDDFAGGMRCFDKSGKEIALYMYATAGRDESGAAVWVVFVARDVTPFWHAEQAVRSAEDKYRMLFEHSSDAVAIADLKGRVLEANPALLRLYGYAAVEVRHLKLTDMVAPEHRVVAAQAMSDLAPGGQVAKTIKMLRKDGGQFVVDLVVSVVLVSGERRILAVTRDVTERVRAEQATNESERKYRLVFESANDAVLLETVGGRIIDANKNACDLLGYTKEELLKLTVSDLVPVEARAWLPRVTDAIMRDRSFRTEAVNVHKSGRRIPVEMSASTMELDDRTLVLAILRDISERKRAEAALAESESRYRTLFSDSLMGIYRTTPDGQIQMANPALVRMLGYESFAQLAERNLETDNSEPEYKREEFKRRLEGDGRIVGLEARWQTRDGRALFVRESARAVRGPDGAVLYYEGTVEDITDRKRAEDALREAEERYRTLQTNVPVGLFRTTPGGAFLSVNAAAVRILGYASEDDMLKTPVADLYADPAERGPLVEELARSGRLRGVELTLKRRDGTSFPAELDIRAVLGPDGRVMYNDGVVQDITERKQAERALRESEEKFRGVSEQSPNMIFINRQGGVAYANRKCQEVMGYLRGEFYAPGFDFMRLIAPESVELIKSVYARHRRGEEVEPYEYTLVTKDGRRIESVITTKLIDYEGGKAILGVVTDITVRKAAERSLRESEERFRRLVDSSPDGIAVYQDGTVVIASRSCARMLGYDSPDAFVGRRAGEFVNPADMATVMEREKLLPAGQPEGPLTVRFRHRAGSWVCLDVVGAACVWNGAPAVLVTIRDSTGRRQAERALREEKELAQSYLEVAGVIMMVLDESGVIRLLNRKGCEVLGCAEAEAVGRNWFNTFVPERLRADVKLVFQGLMRGELVPAEHYENPVVTMRGEERLIAWHNTLLRDEAGRIVGTLSSGEDITESKRLARATEAAEAQMQAVLANSPDGIAAECDGAIAYANQRFAELYGYDSPAQVTGRPVTDFLAPEDHERIAEYSRARTRGEPAPTRYRFKGLRRDSALVEVEITVSTYTLDGRQYQLGFLREAAPRPRRQFLR